MRVQNAMALASDGFAGGVKRFLFEILPDMFPQGYLTETELALWSRFFKEQQRSNKRNRKWPT